MKPVVCACVYVCECVINTQGEGGKERKKVKAED